MYQQCRCFGKLHHRHKYQLICIIDFKVFPVLGQSPEKSRIFHNKERNTVGFNGSLFVIQLLTFQNVHIIRVFWK